MKKIVLLGLLFLTEISEGAGLTVNVGPLSGGRGGSNPLSIPPLNLAEYQVVYITPNSTEFVLGILPGLFYGIRSSEKGPFYASLGAGLVIGMNGGGPGVMSSFGFNLFCSSVCFNMEYRQALALGKGTAFSPYALRIGASRFW